ncbi:hypothetical protein DERP_013463 [Dermatophagoides pteronyssinus]|uniref:Uncharacterized protein n=1 Tax=Dermatophagoides pteronyssinus TaxID=6956 RepID=A0ABQ8JRN5_DERPT|nr:hypothetical protein DERP_013463 [Dermatophagoides pteronyssinus]
MTDFRNIAKKPFIHSRNSSNYYFLSPEYIRIEHGYAREKTPDPDINDNDEYKKLFTFHNNIHGQIIKFENHKND